MVTNTKARRQNNAPVSEETGDQAAVAPQHDLPETGTRKASMTGEALLKAARPANRLLAKQELMTSVNQQLAELIDEQSSVTADGLTNRAEELASNVAFQLFSGQAGGLVTAEETTNILGNQFGWRRKGDAKQRARNIGEQSKTPYGYGETMRKRITRAVKAHTFATSEWEGDNFFKPFLATDNGREIVAEYVEEAKKGETSVFTLYDNLDAERKELTASDEGPVNPVYDPRKVLKQVQKLSEPGSVNIFADNPALIVVYASMIETLEAITSACMALPNAADIIAAVQAVPAIEAE